MDYAKLGYKESITLFEGIEDMETVTIPFPEPPNKNKILNLNRPVSEQKFEVTPLPKRFNSLPIKEKEKFIFQEWDKRVNGYWLMNNGELFYMTGTNYLYVNWWHNKWGKAIFTIPDWQRFLHIQYRLYDTASFGIVEMTARQTGKSSVAGVLAYDVASRHRKFYAGIQSKTDTDAQNFFKDKIVFGWRGLPEFFKPKSDNTSVPKSELNFSEPASRAKGSQKIKMADELSSKIDFQASIDSAYDGQTLDFYVDDECSKVDSSININERWAVVKQAMYDKLNNRIRGKSIHTSTVELMEKQGGKQWKRMWRESRTKDDDGKSLLQPNGQTISGLHQHFTPAYMWGHYNEYGYPDIERNKAEIDAERKNRKGESRASIIRKRPNTIRECFTLSGKECHFNANIIDAVLDKYVFGNPDVATGYFSWEDDVPDSKVKWNPSPEGNMKISHHPDIRLRNLFHHEGNLRLPDNTNFYCAGADPYKKDTTKDARNSDFGFAIYRKWDSSVDNVADKPYDYNGDKITITHVTDRFCLTLRHRYNSRDEYCEQALMACFYFGCEMFSETNVTYLNDYFLKRGYGAYLFHRQNIYTGKWETEAGQDTSTKVKNEIYTEIWNHIEKNGYREVHDDWLREAREIDNDMTEYDLFTACGYAKLAAKRLGDLESDINYDMEDIFPTYAI